MWAYGSHLRVEEKDKGKANCDCIVSVEFHHDTKKNFYVGFIQEIIQVDYGETSPILLNVNGSNHLQYNMMSIDLYV